MTMRKEVGREECSEEPTRTWVDAALVCPLIFPSAHPAPLDLKTKAEPALAFLQSQEDEPPQLNKEV
jgi:hypothetical protein